MYALVKEAYRDLKGQIFILSAKQWQIRITENLITHVRDPTTGLPSLLPSPSEELWPAGDWSQSRLNLKLGGLSPDQKSTLFKLCNDLFPYTEQLQKFKLASSAECQFCQEVDGPLHFFNCTQAKSLGSFLRETLSPLFFTEEPFSWTKVRSLDLSTPSHEDRLSGLVLLSEIVNHILVSRKNSQNASPARLAAVISCRADVTAKTSPIAGATLSTWAERLRSGRQPQDALGSPPGKSQAGDPITLSWGHQPPPCNFSL